MANKDDEVFDYKEPESMRQKRLDLIYILLRKAGWEGEDIDIKTLGEDDLNELKKRILERYSAAIVTTGVYT